MYEMLMAKGWPSEKIVVGLVTTPKNGAGWVPWNMLGTVLPLLVGRHPRFGGVMGWEYFNSLPGGEERPWEWAQAMTTLLRGRRWTAADTKVEVDPDEGAEGDAVVPVPQEFQYHSDGERQDE
jgi:hypothetical protein